MLQGYPIVKKYWNAFLKRSGLTFDFVCFEIKYKFKMS